MTENLRNTRGYHRWTPAQEAFIKEKWDTMTRNEIVEAFNKEFTMSININSIKRKAFGLDLRKSKEALSEISKRPNAGQFKAGDTPANIMYDGAIRIRTDKKGIVSKWIRNSVGKWEQLQHYNWRMAGHTIPEGYILRFKHFDPLRSTNWDVSNLETVSRQLHLSTNKKRKGSAKKVSKARKRKADKVRAKLMTKNKKIRTADQQWMKRKEETRKRESRRVLKTVTRDYSKMVRVVIDHRTSIYINKGEDATAAIAKYHSHKTA